MMQPKFWIIAAIASLGLYACGGGSGSTADSLPVPVASLGAYAQGTVTGFGSVIVDGVTLDDSSASFKVEQDPGASSFGTSNDIKLGMKVESDQGSDSKIKSLTVLPEVNGVITELQAGTGFKVAGQTVRVSTDAALPTVFDGVTALADLLVGDRVEVHGSRDAAGVIVATRIERKDPASATMVRVVGLTSQLNAAAKTLVIGGLTVDFSNAAVLPAGVVLDNGLLVAVWSNQAVSPASVLVAKTLKVKQTAGSSGLKMQVGGLIAALDSKALSFKLGAVPVDASKASFDGGVAADLANGKAVRVSGIWQNGQLVALSVKLVKDSADAQVSLSGAITDYLSLSSFKVRGALVDASAAVIEGGSADNLANGVQVKVQGAVVNSMVQAKTVKMDASSVAASTRTFQGEIKDYNPASGVFGLIGITVPMQLSDKAEFSVDGSEKTAVKADFSNGKKVLVRGDWAGSVLQVKEVKFAAAAPVALKTGGIVSGVSSSQFKLNGVVILWSPATPVTGGTTASLVNGVSAEVLVLKTGGQLQAQSIEIKGRSSGLEIKGVVSDFVSVSNFKVAGQVVDASKAVFSSGKSASLANGRVLQIKGTLINGVLQASSVSFDD